MSIELLPPTETINGIASTNGNGNGNGRKNGGTNGNSKEISQLSRKLENTKLNKTKTSPVNVNGGFCRFVPPKVCGSIEGPSKVASKAIDIPGKSNCKFY